MRDRLITLLEPTVRGLGYELLGIERGGSGRSRLLRLYIDQERGVGVEDCERVSRQISDLLDVEQAVGGEYTLEVSSPGIERPLFTLDQHRRFLGHRVAVRLRRMLDGRRRLQGKLVSVSDDGFVLALDDQHISVSFDIVERSKLTPEWPVARSNSSSDVGGSEQVVG